jgi:hypothetical protein
MEDYQPYEAAGHDAEDPDRVQELQQAQMQLQ